MAALETHAAGVEWEASVAESAVRRANGPRHHPEIERGVSTRAALALVAVAKTQALWEARDFVTPGDLKSALVPTFSHRILVRRPVQGAQSRDEAANLLAVIARKGPVPRRPQESRQTGRGCGACSAPLGPSCS